MKDNETKEAVKFTMGKLRVLAEAVGDGKYTATSSPCVRLEQIYLPKLSPMVGGVVTAADPFEIAD
jgi:hypothetical protein